MISQLKTLVIALVYYSVATLLTVKFLPLLPLYGIVALLYLLPVLVNVLLIRFSKATGKSGLALTVLLPILAFTAYYGFGYLVQSTGLWNDFVQTNSVTSGEMAIKIETDILATSQLIFVGLLYMTGSAINYYLQKKEADKEYGYA